MAFDAYESGDSEVPIVFVNPGETVTCKECRAHLDFVKKYYRGYKRRSQP